MNKLFVSCVFTAILICSGCATASHVTTGNARPEIEWHEVTVYSAAPTNSILIGTVTAYNMSPIWGGWHHAVDKLREEAGKIGANGIVVKKDDLVAFSGEHASGTAIFVP